MEDKKEVEEERWTYGTEKKTGRKRRKRRTRTRR